MMQGRDGESMICIARGAAVCGLHVGLTNHLCEKLHLPNVPQDFRLWRILSRVAVRRIWNTAVLRVYDLG